MIPATAGQNGMTLGMDKYFCTVLGAEYHMGGGKMGGLVHLKLKDIKTGLFLDRKFKPYEKVESVDLDRKTIEYLYRNVEEYHMMHPD